MPLNKESLRFRIIDGLQKKGFFTAKADYTRYLAEVIANAVVDEITANAQVTGVQPGSGNAKIT